MATKSLRIDERLVIQAQREAKVQHRSINGQIEYWAKLGRAIASKISAADAFSVTQGLKEICLETPKSISIDPNAVLNELEADRAKGFSDKPVTSAPFYFEASDSKPGFIDKVNTKTGERQTGEFQNGKFEAI
ncbi:MAG: hypothetical protein FP816_16845 [Desulfobacteraceae bacterium]|nr:hypothetical protein [Desulfobacteraceae bacterium]MBU4000752.1 ParD-like family protein [Pseudomonadota bacterium]MBU4054455.1 ParD-like family protein [Pseudomonadota bacterium]